MTLFLRFTPCCFNEQDNHQINLVENETAFVTFEGLKFKIWIFGVNVGLFLDCFHSGH